jgi:hypothetical protein
MPVFELLRRGDPGDCMFAVLGELLRKNPEWEARNKPK